MKIRPIFIEIFFKLFVPIFAPLLILVAVYFYLDNPQKLSPTQQTFIIPGGTFGVDVNVVITKDTAVIRKCIKDVQEDSLKSQDINSSATTFYKYGYPIVIWFPEICDSPDSYGIIAHELMHTSAYILQSAPVPLNENTQEVYSYQIGYLTQQFFKKWKK